MLIYSKKKCLLFFLVKTYNKKVHPLNIFPACSPQQEHTIAALLLLSALQSFPHMKRFFGVGKSNTRHLRMFCSDVLWHEKYPEIRRTLELLSKNDFSEANS